MVSFRSIQNGFVGGEFSPDLFGRTDFAAYGKALEKQENILSKKQGGAVKRAGTKFLMEVKDSAVRTIIVPFEFNTEQAYILEFGNQYIRFYRNYGQIQSGMAAYEISSVYEEQDLLNIKYVQSNDVMYLVDGRHHPQKLSRTGHTSWTITDVPVLNGPFLNEETTITITPSATTGTAITLTASAALFDAGHVGALWRIKHGSTWGYVQIASYSSATSVTADVIQTLGGTTASSAYQEGAWSDYRGFPVAISFLYERLGFFAHSDDPNRYWLSQTQGFEDFGISDPVVDTDAIYSRLTDGQVNSILWAAQGKDGALIGTAGSEWRLESSDGNNIATDTIRTRRQTNWGSNGTQGQYINTAMIWTTRSGKQIREMLYDLNSDGYKAYDLTERSTHVTEFNGLTRMAYQKEPYGIVWFVREDGQLIGMTYDRDQKVSPIYRYILGGTFDTEQAVVEDVAVIPSPDASRYDVYVIVKRTINGSTARYIEYFMPENPEYQQDVFYVDSGLTFDAPLTITDITNANPAVVTTSTPHGFSNGDSLRIRLVKGMTTVNNKNFTIANVTSTTFELVGTNSTSYPAYYSSGEVRKRVTTITGLDHLEGETVNICGDGAKLSAQTVVSGSITLPSPAAVVHVGLPYTSKMKTLRLEAGNQITTLQGETKIIKSLVIRFYKSLGGAVGPDENNVDVMFFRDSSMPMGTAPQLYSDDKEILLIGEYSTNGQVYIESSDPLPLNISAIVLHGQLES